MKKLFGFILIELCVLFGISPLLFAQEELTREQILEKISEIVNDAGNSLSNSPDCDPYGFQISIKMSKKEGGMASNVFDAEEIQHIQEMVSEMLIPHQFKKFNLEKPLELFSNNGFIYLSVGLTPQNAKKETFAVYFHSYTLKENIDGQFRFFTVQVGAQFIIKTPDNGGIAGDVFYITREGTEKRLNDKDFKSPTTEKKVRYRRLGPGDDASNSGAPDNDEGWKPFQGNQSNFEIVDLTPGHYYPSVKLNGCIQKLEDPKKYKENGEVIIGTQGVFNCDNPTKGQTILKPDGVTATQVLKAEIHTTFSTGNVVEGFILTEGQTIGTWRDSNFVKREDIQVLKGIQKIWIEPHGWVSNDPAFPKHTEAKDGFYQFKDLPSGVYKVYSDGHKEQFKVVEVCNCNEKNEPKSPNMLYQQNLGSSGYTISLDYKYRHEQGNFSFTAVWDNVVIAFGNEEDEPQQISVGFGIPKDSIGNVIDVKGNILQPPFVILESPNGEVICSDIFKYHGEPTSYSNSGIDGLFEEHIPVRFDFKEESLYDAVRIIEYKEDVMIDDLYLVKKGKYMTWSFDGWIKSEDLPEGEMQYVGIEATEIFEHMHKLKGDDITVFVTNGMVDAGIPDDVVELMKTNQEFKFTKTTGPATYTITGTLPD